MESIKKFYSSELATELNGEFSVYYVGRTEDIKNLWQTMVNSEEVTPMFCEPPVFSERKEYYCIEIPENGYASIINSDTFLGMLLEGYVEAEPTTESEVK